MGVVVVMGAGLTCSFGQGGPFPLAVLETQAVVGALPIATVQDCRPLLNIPSFGMCLSTAPPVPCVPAAQPWMPGSVSVLVGGEPALTQSSKCMCRRGGVIQIVSAGQTGTEVAG